VYVNNDPVNRVDPWGLSASDKGRTVTEAERALGEKYDYKAGNAVFCSFRRD
jgi:hypothetical protein